MISDHDRESIVVAVRGSISLRDIFTDFTAGSEKFEADGNLLPSFSFYSLLFYGLLLILFVRNTIYVLIPIKLIIDTYPLLKQTFSTSRERVGKLGGWLFFFCFIPIQNVRDTIK